MRDWTVASATAVFALGYAAVVVVTQHLAATPATAPSLARALLWTFLLCGVVGGTAIAIGSGRAAIWTSFLPASLRACGGGGLAAPGLVRRRVGAGAPGRAGRSTGTARST